VSAPEVVAVAERVYTTAMTSEFDGLAHEITDEAFAEATTGYYPALCGVQVGPTPAIAPVGRACSECIRLLFASRGLGPEPVYVQVPKQCRSTRHRQHGRLWSLLHGQLAGREAR
jgi:hypothetical protein